MKSWQKKLQDEVVYWRDKYYNLQSEVESLKKIISVIEKSDRNVSDIIEASGRIASASGEAIHSMSNFMDKASRIMDK